MKAMILAAGEGTRLRPLTLTTPKPMLPVRDCPTLEWIVGWLRSHGVRDLIVNLYHLPEVIEDYFGDGSRCGVTLAYSREETLLGTAGALDRVASQLTDDFLVVYGDVLTDLDVSALLACHEAHRVAGAPHITLSLNQAPNPWDCGVVAVDDDWRVTRFVEKPPRDQIFSPWTNAGVLVLPAMALAAIDTVPSDISRHLLPRLLAQGVPCYGWPLPADTYLLDMGSSTGPVTEIRRPVAFVASSVA